MRGPDGRSQVCLEHLGAPVWGLGLSLSRRAVLLEWTQQNRPGMGPGETECDSGGIVGNEVEVCQADEVT